MPTTRGWALGGAGLALVLLWYLLGDEELLMAGSALVLATVAALVYVRLISPEISVGRRLGSGAVHDGDTMSVTLLLRNRGGRPVRHLQVTDNVESLGAADFEIGVVDAEEAVTTSYRVQCRPRGLYRVGPTVTTASDPLGLAERVIPGGPTDTLIVYPRVEALSGLPVVRGQDPSMAAARPEQAQRGGEDFFTLREYQRGDDLRRVHWPSSARTEELMIRQLETPWQSRALVLLDVRSEAYESNTAFETAVSGAASVVTHLVQSGFDADLWAGDPTPIDASRYAAAMQTLALVQSQPGLDLKSVASHIRQKGGGGALVLVTGNADRDLVAVHQVLSGEYPTTVLLNATSTTSQAIAGFHRLGVTTVTTAPGGSWSESWIKTIGAKWDAVSPS